MQSAFTELGVIAVREDVNLEAAFWAQFPGNFKYIARSALVSSGNFAGLASLHNFPVGQAEDNHWGPAVTVLETTAAGPYFFNFHHGDLGNFTIIGPSGSGKTVVLNFLLAQARRFDPRIVFFDKDRGAEPFIRAIGGRYDVLRPGKPTGFNPLLLPDEPANRRFLARLDRRRLVSANGDALRSTPRTWRAIAEAVDANFDGQAAAVSEAAALLRRTVPGRAPSRRRRPRRAPATGLVGDGEHAWLFDNEDDELDLDARRPSAST